MPAEERCRICLGLRLDAAGAAAARLGVERFATSLTVSPYQRHDLIAAAGEAAARRHGVTFLFLDLRDQFRDSYAESRRLFLYRQPYCGCAAGEWKGCRAAPLAARGMVRETTSSTLDDLDYDLPPELVAQQRLAARDASRLVALPSRRPGRSSDGTFRDLPALLCPGDVLVRNDTRVFPARCFFRRATGGRIEALFLRPGRPGRRRRDLGGAAAGPASPR